MTNMDIKLEILQLLLGALAYWPTRNAANIDLLIKVHSVVSVLLYVVYDK